METGNAPHACFLPSHGLSAGCFVGPADRAGDTCQASVPGKASATDCDLKPRAGDHFSGQMTGPGALAGAGLSGPGSDLAAGVSPPLGGGCGHLWLCLVSTVGTLALLRALLGSHSSLSGIPALRYWERPGCHLQFCWGTGHMGPRPQTVWTQCGRERRAPGALGLLEGEGQGEVSLGRGGDPPRLWAVGGAQSEGLGQSSGFPPWLSRQVLLR